jgi:hypothetical protein
MEERMQRRRAIREKLLLGSLLVGVMVAVLSASSFLGVYSYRRLVRALSSRAAELPRASELGECVGLLRLSHARALADDVRSAAFIDQLPVAHAALQGYCAELEEGEIENTPFGDRSRELATTQQIADCLTTIEARVRLPFRGRRRVGRRRREGWAAHHARDGDGEAEADERPTRRDEPVPEPRALVQDLEGLDEHDLTRGPAHIRAARARAPGPRPTRMAVADEEAPNAHLVTDADVLDLLLAKLIVVHFRVVALGERVAAAITRKR